MKKALRHRPSAALIVACLALFVALGGVGYAAATINGKDIVKGTITAKQVKDRSLGTKDLSKKSVKALKGQKGAKGDTGPQGVQGVQGTPGAPGSAVAYAFVAADGTVDPARSKNVETANVVPDGGIYGFRGLSFEPKNIQVTMSFDSASVTGDNVGGGVAYVGDCNFVDGVDQACVSANNDTDPASEPRPFFVVFN